MKWAQYFIRISTNFLSPQLLYVCTSLMSFSAWLHSARWFNHSHPLAFNLSHVVWTQTPSLVDLLIWSPYKNTEFSHYLAFLCWTYLTAVCEVLFSSSFTPRFYQLNGGAQVCSFDLSLESFHIGSALTASCYSHNALLVWRYCCCYILYVLLLSG